MPMKTALRVAVAGLLAFAAALRIPAQDDMHAANQGPGFELPGPVDARRFLPAILFETKPYRVSAEAFNDGLLNTYSLRAGREAIPVTGTTALLER
jgi:hypothetical protein